MANQKLIDEVGKYIEKYYEEPECSMGSYAESYARKNKIKYQLI